jgi:hypothetical protein
MKIKNLIPCTLVLILSTGILYDPTSIYVNKFKLRKPTLAIVLCDVSGTVTRQSPTKVPNSLTSIIRHADSIVLSYYPVRSTIIFLPISRVRHAEILEEIYLKNTSKAGKAIEIKKRLLSLEQLKKKLVQLSLTDSKNTCILTSIENAYDIFRIKAQKEGFASSEVDYELVIISDFIEDCRDSPIGEINMQRNLDGSLMKINKLVSEVNLDKLSIRIKLVTTAQFSSAEFERKSLNFWRAAFQKMRYNDVNKLILAPML